MNELFKLRQEVEELKAENAVLKDALRLVTRAFVQLDDERDPADDFPLAHVSDDELAARVETIRQTIKTTNPPT